MPKIIPIQREQKEDDYVVSVVIAKFAMLVFAAYIVASFLAGAVDIGAPTDASQLWAP